MGEWSNMKKFLLIIVLTTSALFFGTGCLTAGNPAGMGPFGGLITYTTSGFSAPKLNGPKEKEAVGEACNTRLLLAGIIYGFTSGDATVRAAMRKANIREIYSINQTHLNVLLLYGRQCTVVRGSIDPNIVIPEP